MMTTTRLLAPCAHFFVLTTVFACAEPRQSTSPSQECLLRSQTLAVGTRASISFAEESTLHVQSLRSTMGDDVFERQAPDRSVKQIAQREWEDTVLEGESGRIVRRSVVEAGGTMEITNSRNGSPQPDGNSTATSSLVGRTVEFVENDGSFTARYVKEAPEQGSQGDSAPTDRDSGGPSVIPTVAPAPLPSVLRPDLSLHGFLPPDDGWATVGEEWNVDPNAMRDVLSPGGDMVTYFGPLENQIDSDMIARFGAHAVSRFNGEVTGDVRATLAAVPSQPAARVAQIEIRFDVSLTRDPTFWTRVQSTPFEMAKIGQGAENARHTMTLTGSGTLLWDLDHHRFVEFRAQSETRSEHNLDYTFDLRGHHYTGDEHFEFAGTTELLLTASYAEQ